MSQSSMSLSADEINGLAKSNNSSMNAGVRVSSDTNHSSISGGPASDKSHTFISNNTLKNISTTPSDWIQLPKMDNIVDIFGLCCSTAIIVGSLAPYIPQYLKIKRSMNSDGFSTYVCLTLLIANILRIMFWFGSHFETPLLIQSFVVIFGMLVLMELCVRVRDKSSSFTISSGLPNRQRRLINGKRPVRNPIIHDQSSVYAVSSQSPASHLAGVGVLDSCSYQNWRPTTRPDAVLDAATHAPTIDSVEKIEENSSYRYDHLSSNCCIQAQHRYQSLIESNENPGNPSWSCSNMKYTLGSRDFWDWDDFNSYLYFLFLFTLATSLLTYLLIDNKLYIESLGFVAVLTESMLGLPQLLRNYRKKSTLGMSVEMVVMWLSGDLFKTLYYVLRHTPRQFTVCGTIQVIVDILILYQVLWYRRPRVNYRKLPTTVTR